MIGKGATPSFFAIANDNYTLTIQTSGGLPIAASSGKFAIDIMKSSR